MLLLQCWSCLTRGWCAPKLKCWNFWEWKNPVLMPWGVWMLNWSKTVSPLRQEGREQKEPGCFPATWHVTRMTGYSNPETLAAPLLFKERYMDSFCVDFLLLHALPNVLGDQLIASWTRDGSRADWYSRDGKKKERRKEKRTIHQGVDTSFLSGKLSFAHFHSHIRMDRKLSQLNGTRPINTLLKSTVCLSELGGRNTTKGTSHTLCLHKYLVPRWCSIAYI